MGVGRATRLLRFLGDLPKTYEGTLRLGESRPPRWMPTVTSSARVAVDADDDRVRRRDGGLIGDSIQCPPPTPPSRWAAEALRGRAGGRGAPGRGAARSTWRPSRCGGVSDDDVDFRVVCGGGTYVRVLAADVGDALGCGAHLTRLRRTAIGSFPSRTPCRPMSPARRCRWSTRVAHLPRGDVDAEEAIAVSHGRILGPAGVEGPYAVVAPDGRILGIYGDDGTKASPGGPGPRGPNDPDRSAVRVAPTQAGEQESIAIASGSAIPARPQRSARPCGSSSAGSRPSAWAGASSRNRSQDRAPVLLEPARKLGGDRHPLGAREGLGELIGREERGRALVDAVGVRRSASVSIMFARSTACAPRRGAALEARHVDHLHVTPLAPAGSRASRRDGHSRCPRCAGSARSLRR